MHCIVETMEKVLSQTRQVFTRHCSPRKGKNSSAVFGEDGRSYPRHNTPGNEGVS